MKTYLICFDRFIRQTTTAVVEAKSKGQARRIADQRALPLADAMWIDGGATPPQITEVCEVRHDIR